MSWTERLMARLGYVKAEMYDQLASELCALNKQVDKVEANIQRAEASLHVMRKKEKSELKQLGENLRQLLLWEGKVEQVQGELVCQMKVGFEQYQRIVKEFELKNESVELDFLMDAMFATLQQDMEKLLRLHRVER